MYRSLLRSSASLSFKFPRYTAPSRLFIIARNMSGLSVELTAPNGVKYTQPTGLFINNEWVKSTKGDKIYSINPT
jgi:hypothetical protein